ncbi:mCG148275 [Mus musculus]|jgi:hypothetical protein|nr:mCG148275 [Mus musculus]
MRSRNVGLYLEFCKKRVRSQKVSGDTLDRIIIQVKPETAQVTFLFPCKWDVLRLLEK